MFKEGNTVRNFIKGNRRVLIAIISLISIILITISIFILTRNIGEPIAYYYPEDEYEEYYEENEIEDYEYYMEELEHTQAVAETLTNTPPMNTPSVNQPPANNPPANRPPANPPAQSPADNPPASSPVQQPPVQTPPTPPAQPPASPVNTDWVSNPQQSAILRDAFRTISNGQNVVISNHALTGHMSLVNNTNISIWANTVNNLAEMGDDIEWTVYARTRTVNGVQETEWRARWR